MNNEQQRLLKRTVTCDAVRACMLTPQESAFRGSGLAVLVTLQFFDGADWQKGLMAAVPFIGMLLSPLAVSVATYTRITVSRLAGIMIALAAPGLLMASFAPSLTIFMIGILISVPVLGSTVPLITAIWQQNAPASLRGHTFSRVTFIGGIAAVASTLLISLWLGDDPGRYRPVTLCFAVMVVIAGFAAWRIPSLPLERPAAHHGPYGTNALSLLWKDRLFGYLCIAQMLIGVANLATIPLRTEFLGSAERGMGYTAGTVFLIAVVIPEIFRLLSIPLYGKFFDRVNFAVVRMTVSSGFVISLLCTFSPLLPVQLIGAATFGAAMGGAKIVWTLWVTKLAPAERTADYMGIHTFLTGARGIVAPQIAFAALACWSVRAVGFAAAGMVVFSILMLVPTIPKFRATGRITQA